MSSSANIKWHNIKSTQVIESYLKLFYVNCTNNKHKLEYIALTKTIGYYQLLLNMSILTVFSRWLDIPIVVKNGSKYILPNYINSFYLLIYVNNNSNST